MADLQRLLGGMMASGMGGRTRRGSAFLGSSGGSLKTTAGIGALAYLAYKAYQEYQKNSPGSAGAKPASTGTGTTTASTGATTTTARAGGPSLGERLGDLLGMGSEPEPAPAPAALDDAHAMLLIRAMIAAANADGEIAPDERRSIESKLDQAGAGPEERAVLERELQNPLSVDQIVRQVRDQETAEQVYLASRIAMNPDTAAEKAYLDFLASRLKIPGERLQQLDSVV